MTEPIVTHGAGARVRVWAVPNSSRTVIVGLHDGRVKIRVAAPPERGKATAEIIRLLEGILGTRVALVSGMSERAKVFEVADRDVQTVRRKLGVAG